ncbi:MAG: TSUP family transporter [Gaiellaceae bacterium]
MSIGATARTRTESPAGAAGARRVLAGLEPRLVAIGIAGGVLSGLLGVGGGIVMVPLLVIWAAYSQRDAHAISLGAIIPISCASVLTYGVAGRVRPGEAAALAVGSIAGARIGAGALSRIGDRPLKLVFGLFLAAVSVLMLVRS